MKITAAILTLLIARRVAADAQVVDIQFGDTATLNLLREAAEARAAGDYEGAAEIRKALRYPSSKPESVAWQTDCSVSASFEAEIYVVPDLTRAPKEVQWAMEYLDEYWKTDDGGDLPYPGDFDRFMHPGGFRVMRVDYKDLPWTVRQYREELLAEGTAMQRKFIAELNGVAFFAPGVVTWLGPLFAGTNVKLGENACQDELVTISNFLRKKTSGDDVRFDFSYQSRVQVGNSVTVELQAKKRSKATTAQEGFRNEEL
ncbi:hypothetical protein FZEAL_6884 [Fusarium zealandicum]|uniref:Uncharacterized protein n=1 Tax=Fusarium zealandicum TaxID=1053134 RepID=A0A8H4XJ11_9HYPO|nr:hypothetical protein FZEAL_6884 [Fusarium zealandicum]